jgi:rare lipoprotein A
LFDRAGGRDRRGNRRAVIAGLAKFNSSRNDVMKWTLMVTTCLLAFAFSPPVSARHSPNGGHSGLHRQHASTSKHIGPGRAAGRRHGIAAIRQRREPGKNADDRHVVSLARHHASSASRHGQFVATRNTSGREASPAESEGGSIVMASYYGASGMTAAHRTLPFGTMIRVTNLANGNSVTVRIADRGPFIRGRALDLSSSAARAIGMTGAGVTRVRMHVM